MSGALRLGGPGSGKTWLARRAVRLCAEAAMDALAAGSEVDEIELPLFTTCARLSATPFLTASAALWWRAHLANSRT